MPFIHVNKIDLYYTKQGQGEPLLFLHGNGEDHTIFKPLIDKLAEHFTCYAIDSRNHGKSAQTNEFHYQTMMEDIHQFITTLNLNKPNIIGFSDGSIITMLLAIQFPALMNKIVLLGPNLTPNDLTDACTRYLKRLYKNDPNPLYKMMLEEPNIQECELQKIEAKTLIIGGENDLYNAGTFERIQKNIRHSTLKIIPNHDHSSYINQNDLLYNDLCTFLNKYFTEHLPVSNK